MHSDTPSSTSGPLQLHYSSDGQDIVVTPEDQDRFVISVTDAINACKVFDQVGMVNFRGQYELMLQRLGSWINDHDDSVSQAMVTTRDSGLLFLVATETPQFSAELEDALTDLDISIANDPNLDLIRLSVLAVPSGSDSAMGCFADRSTMMVYAK